MLGVKRMPRPLSESRKPESRRKTSVCAGHAPATNRFTPGFPGQPCALRERVVSVARRLRVLRWSPIKLTNSRCTLPQGCRQLFNYRERFCYRFAADATNGDLAIQLLIADRREFTGQPRIAAHLN